MYRAAQAGLWINGAVDKVICLPEVLVGFSVSRQGAAALNRMREKVREQTGFMPVAP